MCASLLRRDDQRVLGSLGRLPEIGGAAAGDARDRFTDASLVDAETAIDPGELAAGLVGGRQERRNPFLGERMVLLRRVAPVNGVRVLGLLGERQDRGAL